MKNTIFLITLLLLSAHTLAAPVDDFVITIKSDNPGSSADTAFMIPTSGGGYNYNVDCNDDGINEATAQTGNFTCDFSTLGGVGSYTIRIKDNSGAGTGFPRIFFNDTGDKEKIIDLQQWGTGQWLNMTSAFDGTLNMLVSAMDTPDFSAVTNMAFMFHSARVANPDTTNWDTSMVTDMRQMFAGAYEANPDTSNWDTSSVRRMNNMFEWALAANPDTSNWDTSLVFDMRQMFVYARIANPDTSNWDTSAVLNMEAMFGNARMANPNTSNWDTSLVRNMQYMFEKTDVADPDTSNWDTSSVTTMNAMFSNAIAANPDTSNWNTSSVIFMSRLFENATNATPNTSNWNTAMVEHMAAMFSGNTVANPDTSNWDTSSVTSMFGMFRNATNANPDTSDWDVTALLDGTNMFEGVTLPTTTYDALLNNWGAQVLNNGVVFDAGNSRFCNSDIARSEMINTFAWAITDGGLGCSVDISVTKTLDTAAPYNVGDGIQYTLVVSNTGPDSATDVLVSDTPTNLTITSVSSPNCTAMPCTIASMANGAIETITITATINTEGAFDNSASAFAQTSDIETDMSNNTDNSDNGGGTTSVDCNVQPWHVNDETELSDAIVCFNTKVAVSNYTISLNQNINLTTSSTTINNSTTGISLLLEGNNFVVDGQDIDFLKPFEVEVDTTAIFQNISIIRGNSNGSGSGTVGGGILNRGTLTVNSSIIRNNTAGEDGGAIYNQRGTLTINNSTISNNIAREDGGGIATYLGTVIINNSAIHNNTASEDGGGGIQNRGTLTVNNSTISNNEADFGDGGGILNRETLTINNSTIGGNSSASSATGIINEGTLMMSNTVVDNAITGNNCVAGSAYNIISSLGGACGLNDGVDGNIVGQDPLLEALQDNGGLTFTQALLTGSPAINSGDPAYPTTGYDQRGVGFDRVINGRLDMGAYEASDFYTIGGNLTGLASGNTVTIQNNNGENLSVDSDRAFTFATALADGSPYAVTVLNQPSSPSQVCTATNNSGQINGANVIDIAVNCLTTLPVLQLSNTSVDFNSVMIGDSQNALITVSNQGSVDLTISGISSPVAPFSFVGSCLNLPVILSPMSSCEIEIIFSPTTLDTFNDAISISSDAASSPDQIVISGSGVSGAPINVPTLNIWNLLLLVLLMFGVVGSQRRRLS